MSISDVKSTTGNVSDYCLDDQVGFILRRATQRHLAIFGEKIPGMTATQFAALSKLCEAGRVSQNQLGRQTAMDGATIKGVIDRLRKRGLVATRPDPDDQRRLLVEVTRAGQRTYRSHIGDAQKITEDTLSPFDDEERRRFLELLEKLT